MALDFQALRKQLEEERTQLRARAIPEPEPAKGDEADMAAMHQAREQARWLENDQKQRLAEIDKVLARIAAGQYGICESCGKSIAPERLQAKPQATLCIECQSKLEKKRK
jgi:RNA polymerase-binding protein DksA